jgi:hypothetical protein
MHGSDKKYTSPVRKLDGKGQHGRPRRQARDNVKPDQRKKLEVVDWIDFVQDTTQWRNLVNTVMNPQNPKKA